MASHGKKTLYPYVLDHKPGFFLNGLLYRLFKRVRLDENMKEALKQMHKKGSVVYASKYKGKLDYLLYHYNFRRRRLPYPRIAFDLNISLFLPISRLFKILVSQISAFFRYGRIPNPYQSGFYSRAIQKGTPSLIFLVDPKGFIRQFIHSEKDHLQFLLETQKDTDHPIFIVPQLILYKKTPEKDYTSLANILFGFKDHPGFIRKIALFFRHYHHAFIDFGRPLDLKAYLSDQPAGRPLNDMATEIKQMLIDDIDGQKRVLLGPIMKSRQQIKEIVLRDPRVTRYIEKRASEKRKTLKQLRKKAGEYFDEIAADFNITYVQLFYRALKWLWKKIFEEIDVNKSDQAKVREWARRGPLIFIPSHKSHIDYLVLNYVLYDYNMHIPRIAAGQNLTFWPMGYIFRKSGAFFIRRSFKGARLYAEVFGRYIKALLEEGHPIEFYIEGGRSRNGKLVLPKIGFLSILLRAYHEGFCKDLIFVPTSIIYDRVLEEKSYLKEINGGTKEKESFRQIINARRFLKKKYGKIYVRFNNPFSLNEYLSQREQDAKDTTKDLAFHLVRSINEVSVVTPLSLIATAVLAAHRSGFHMSELLETVNILLKFLENHKMPIANTLNDPSKAVKDTVSLLTNWKVVNLMEEAPGEEETFYYVDDDKKMELEYYKNNIIHFYIHHSFVALSLLNGIAEEKETESIISDYTFLKELFKNEFVFDKDEDLHGKIGSITEYFLKSGFLTRSNGDRGYKITKLGFDKLPVWAALSKTFLESYWIAAKAISQKKDGGGLLKSMNYLGKRLYKQGVIDHIGALSQVNYRNAMGFINRNVLNSNKRSSKDRPSSFESLSQFSKRLYDLSHYGQ
ncbi:MAG: 1-acyl-sn-glycerol-3-phosphate acyltransferase [Deltaproteobacteria bacterium]|nr:1-acyl-sn-glycerol-3-phosphate acyltransferase [Deltaproteobacteria bacterium]